MRHFGEKSFRKSFVYDHKDWIPTEKNKIHFLFFELEPPELVSQNSAFEKGHVDVTQERVVDGVGHKIHHVRSIALDP